MSAAPLRSCRRSWAAARPLSTCCACSRCCCTPAQNVSRARARCCGPSRCSRTPRGPSTVPSAARPCPWCSHQPCPGPWSCPCWGYECCMAASELFSTLAAHRAAPGPSSKEGRALGVRQCALLTLRQKLSQGLRRGLQTGIAALAPSSLGRSVRCRCSCRSWPCLRAVHALVRARACLCIRACVPACLRACARTCGRLPCPILITELAPLDFSFRPGVVHLTAGIPRGPQVALIHRRGERAWEVETSYCC
mmetsp:Transcript_91856/g.297226  ORF Transcript_91856/g.297226 Transcript_91856/m.297226 type:complete len:251 (+) Transcript_91856:471-1223(+)